LVEGAYSTVIGIFLKQKNVGKPLTIVGNGNQRRDFTYVKDILCYMLNGNRSLLELKINNIRFIQGSALGLEEIDNLPKNNSLVFCGNLINFYNNFKTLKNILNEKPDVIHLTYYSNYLINNNKDYVLTVYDLFHETFNNNNKFRPKTLALKNAKHIICISQKTKKDLINFYGVDQTKISVIYLGGDHILRNNTLLINF
jgi:hypothetical protein